MTVASSSRLPAAWLAGSLGVGAAAAVVYTLSPLTVVAAAGAVLLLWAAVTGLPADQRRWLWIVLGSAIALRLLVIMALLLISEHDTQAAAILTGDEAYSLSRTLRLRNILLGIPGLKYDYQIAFEDYAETSYLTLLTVLQMLFGPSPYGLRLVNMLLFLGGAILLFHMVRVAFGRLAAFAALIGVILLPTLLFWSIALLKESLYFALTATVLTSAYAAFRAHRVVWRVGAFAAAGAALWALHDLRAGAVYLVGGGTALGITGYVATASKRRAASAVLAAIIATAALSTQPAATQRLRAAIDAAARIQIGHVFTVGHAYKTLDEGFYVRMDHFVTLRPGEAARYVVRSLASFLVAPWPWRMQGGNELMFLPEHVLWYVALLFALVGAAAGLARDRLATCLFVGIIIPTSLVVALTNGNVGTLIRFRGLVWPYVLALAALGACVVAQRLLRRQPTSAGVSHFGRNALGEQQSLAATTSIGPPSSSNSSTRCSAAVRRACARQCSVWAPPPCDPQLPQPQSFASGAGYVPCRCQCRSASPASRCWPSSPSTSACSSSFRPAWPRRCLWPCGSSPVL